jgi:hypothetical protein
MPGEALMALAQWAGQTVAASAVTDVWEAARHRVVLAATLFAHEPAAFGVDVPAGLGGDLLLAAVVRLGGCRGCPAR